MGYVRRRRPEVAPNVIHVDAYFLNPFEWADLTTFWWRCREGGEETTQERRLIIFKGVAYEYEYSYFRFSYPFIRKDFWKLTNDTNLRREFVFAKRLGRLPKYEPF